ncbi:ParB family chromosome partitioning protein [Nonomuraea thailandensis]|uniref:ParB family chromosome partitioning protein n=1 Tax=Nonomuraea thailandensis TaxID=1188745 RepID=A0A9X2GY10_9ACTN|nr:ParB/RepB/Spo0J family partition protein [Nonomuraea thailandensis]MCP2365719.1 ParB family chromosome partitioning protein [Nonomuraea thailandensis]
MAGKRTSLASLMVGATAESEPPKWPDKIKLSELADNPANPREQLRDLEGLAATIAEEGILQRLVVVPRDAWLTAHPEHGGRIGQEPYVILIGHRRRHAAELAGLVEVPVEVRESAVASRRTALIENLQRDGLAPLEEARGVRDLMEEENLSQREAAAVLGKSQGWISQRLVLLNLTSELQDALTRGRLRIEDAREIGKLPPEQQAMPAPPAPPAEPEAGRPQAERRQPVTGEAAKEGPPAERQPRPAGDEDPLDEALRVEAAAHQVGNLRVLRRVAQRQPAKARAILQILETAVKELRAGLADRE